MQLELCDSAPAGWTRLSISDVCQRFTSGGTPSRKLPEYFTGSIPWVKTQELTDCVLHDSEEHITEHAIANSSAKLLPTNTVLMAMYGATVGQLGVLARPMTCNQACAAMVVDEVKVDHRFLYYQLLACRQQIKSLSTGAAQQNLSGAQIKQFVLPYPSRSEQSVVAEFLWQLDRRIDLLRQTNTTLESIAQALFKSWFIDFDPVRAKAEGREPDGMDAATAALFPAELVESPLGLIPRGWTVQRLSDLMELAYGKALKSIDRRDGHVPVYGSGGITGFHDEPLVPHGSVIVGRKGTVGSLYWEDRPFFPIDTTFYVKPRTAPMTFCFHALQRMGLESMNTDAAVPGLNRENAYRLEVTRPDAAVMKAFDNFISSLRQAMRCNDDRAALLGSVRDSLLPRLISGKPRLPEAQQALEAVAA